MATAIHSLRRRAAWAVLAAVMDEDELIEALWQQHDSMRGDSVSDIIGFIDGVATRHLLDAATRKRLYAAYFDALRQPEETLPIDPWPLMLLARPSAAAVAPAPMRYEPPVAQPTYAPTYAPQYAPQYAPPYPPQYPPPGQAYAPPYAAQAPQGYAQQPAYARPGASPAGSLAGLPLSGLPIQAADAAGAAPHVAAAERAAANAAPGPTVTPAQAVFATLAHGIVSAVRQSHASSLAEFLSECRTSVNALRMPSALRLAVGEALAKPGPSAWHLDASQEQMSAFVHEMYVCLCETLGPVSADQVLMHAVRLAEQRPEAQQVSPKRFL